MTSKPLSNSRDIKHPCSSSSNSSSSSNCSSSSSSSGSTINTQESNACSLGSGSPKIRAGTVLQGLGVILCEIEINRFFLGLRRRLFYCVCGPVLTAEAPPRKDRGPLPRGPPGGALLRRGPPRRGPSNEGVPWEGSPSRGAPREGAPSSTSLRETSSASFHGLAEPFFVSYNKSVFSHRRKGKSEKSNSVCKCTRASFSVSGQFL
ncbi:hypothetical protein Emed_003284 [Eimeria media]